MGMSMAENRMLNEIARRMADEDPEFTRRMSAFGGYETSVLGLPSRTQLLPVVLVGVLLLVTFLGVAVATAESAHGSGGTGKSPAAQLRP